jgi:hypothetical protein
MRFMSMLQVLICGLVATGLLDLWQRFLLLTRGLPPTSWALVGRWFNSTLRGRPFPGPAAQLSPVRGELAMGWVVHYAVGIGYGLVYVLGLGSAGFDLSSPWTGLAFGLASVAVPFFFFMPAMGAGLLGRHAPNPRLARMLATASHAVFGLGLALGSAISGALGFTARV